MRVLSSGYSATETACPTFRALYHGLEEFERDLHQHVHLENNILFPRALHMEQGTELAPKVPSSPDLAGWRTDRRADSNATQIAGSLSLFTPLFRIVHRRLQ